MGLASDKFYWSSEAGFAKRADCCSSRLPGTDDNNGVLIFPGRYCARDARLDSLDGLFPSDIKVDNDLPIVDLHRKGPHTFVSGAHSALSGPDIKPALM